MMGHKTLKRGYYWVKFYNHERKMILFYTGIFWEQFDHDDRINDEIESYEHVEEPSSVTQANKLLPYISFSDERADVCDCKNPNRKFVGTGMAICSCGNLFDLSKI